MRWPVQVTEIVVLQYAVREHRDADNDPKGDGDFCPLPAPFGRQFCAIEIIR